MSKEPRPWWPDLRLPVEGPKAMPDGSSGSILIQAGTNTPPILVGGDTIGQGTYVCGVDYRTPTPCVLTIGTQGLAGSVPGPQGVQSVELPVGQATYETGHSTNASQGFVDVTYGVGASRQRLVMDLRPGTYQLPPCEQVRVSALGWYFTSNGGFKKALNLSAGIAPGLVARASDPTYSMFYSLTATTVYDVVVPDKARTVDCWGLNVAALGSGKPVISLYSSGENGFPSLVRDYSLGIWAPPFPAACFGGYSGLVASIVSTVTCKAWVQYGLEF